MARKKNDDHVRTITKVAGGKSYCITLPIKIVREMNWESQQKVIVRRRGNKIIIEDPQDLVRANGKDHSPAGQGISLKSE